MFNWTKFKGGIKILRHCDLEIIPTGYILVDEETKTATQKVTNTKASEF